MKDPRIPAVARAIETRFPGTRVEIDRFRDPEGDRLHRWVLEVLFVREKAMGKGGVGDFAYKLAFDLYGTHEFPFYVALNGTRGSRAYLAEKRERAATRGGSPRARGNGSTRPRRGSRRARVARGSRGHGRAPARQGGARRSRARIPSASRSTAAGASRTKRVGSTSSSSERRGSPDAPRIRSTRA